MRSALRHYGGARRPGHEAGSGETVNRNCNTDRDADITDAVHVCKRNRARHRENVAEKQQARMRHGGRVQEPGRVRERSGSAQGTPRRRHHAVVREDRDEVARRTEREHSYSGKAPVRNQEHHGERIRRDVEDPMEQRAPVREHSQDQGLNHDRAEDCRRVSQMDAADGREVPAREGHGDDAQDDGGEQQHPADFPRYANTAVRRVIGRNDHSLLPILRDL